LNINVTLTIARQVIDKAFPKGVFGDDHGKWRELVMRELGP
jgi:hypothetical protein